MPTYKHLLVPQAFLRTYQSAKITVMRTYTPIRRLIRDDEYLL
eukprot:SAG31_NODE_5299_length_2624_cov_2.500990_3_plen_42_part_01